MFYTLPHQSSRSSSQPLPHTTEPHATLIPSTIPPPQATIESLDQKARGVAHVEGKAIFIEGALPGEVVSFQSYLVKPSYEIARVIDIIQPSPQRVTPACAHFDVCGGCRLQHLQANTQLTLKQRLLEDTLWHIGRVRVQSWLPPLDGPSWGYRHRARLSVRFVTKKNRVLVGFHEKSGRFIADIVSCAVLAKPLDSLIKPLQELIMTLSICRHLPQIEVGVGDEALTHHSATNSVLLILRILEPLSAEDTRLLLDFETQYGVSFYLQSQGIASIVPLSTPKTLHYHLPDYRLRYAFLPHEFTQVNFAMNRLMVGQAMMLLAPHAGQRIADFFCGMGNFSLAIARHGAQVLGIEGDKALVARATANAAQHDLARAQFMVSNLFQMTSEALTELGLFDGWLIDPPRDGALALVQAITEVQAPHRIVYVSCHPASLARDAHTLVHDKGYTLLSAGVMQMFPHTTHTEAMALFERGL